jgi:hypothetical protein
MLTPCHQLYAAHFARVESVVMSLGNHNLDSKLYHYLFARMDTNGIAGTDHAVARGRIALDLSEKGGQGKRNRLITFTPNDIDVSLLRLERAGLIERLSDRQTLRIKFSAFIADSHSYIQNEVPNHVPNKLVRSPEPKTHLNQTTYVNKREGSPDEVTREVPTNILQQQQTTIRDSAFAMNLDWKTSEAFAKRLAIHQIRPEQVFAGWVGEFVSYWQTRPNIVLTQSEWEHKLLQNIISRLKNPNIGISNKATFVSRASQPNQTSNPNSADKPPIAPIKKIVIPNLYDGSQLQNWAVKNGFRASKVGESTEQYKAALRNEAEKRYQSMDSRSLH